MLLTIPQTECANPAGDDEALAEKRRKIKEALLNKQQVKVTPDTGSLTTEPTGGGIVVPEGKLASFYWYDNNRELYHSEIEAMRLFFPSFRLDKEADGRLSWLGQVSPGLIGSNTYTLHAVYDHDHPSNNTYGGSVKVYCVDPDLEELARQLVPGKSIPHTLRDSRNAMYICTAQKSDFHASRNKSTTAASALSWAVKWLSVFELWLYEDVSDEQFRTHTF